MNNQRLTLHISLQNNSLWLLCSITEVFWAKCDFVWKFNECQLMGFYYFTIYFRVYWNSIPAAQQPHFIHVLMQTFEEVIQVWNFKRVNFGYLFDVQPIWLLRISSNIETIFSQPSPVYHWTTSLRAAPWFPVLTARQRAARSLPG